MDEKSLNVRQLCLGQAQGFIDAAERLGGGLEWPHIVYHLSLLALEEVGKASMISAGSVRAHREDSFVERWVDNHRRKLQWAVWSPMLNASIDPADFQAAREFADRAHALRLASLYVDPKADLHDVPASDQVKPADAEGALRLARARLAYEEAHEPSPAAVGDEILHWFLDTMDDAERSKMILSPPFIAKYAELEGDTRAWVGWARDELNRLDTELREIAEAEMQRPGSTKGGSKPRWRANATIYTPSHSVRPKILARWNALFDTIQLVALANKKDRFTLQITLYDNEPIADLAGRLTSLAKLTVACLNIGSIGYFWFEPAGFEQELFKGIRDLKRGGVAISISMGESFWGNGRAVALTEQLVENAITCMMAFLPMSDAEAEPIFSHYLNGLAFIAKSDVFYNLDQLARREFVWCLFGALQHFGGPFTAKDPAAAQAELDARLHEAFVEIVPERENREMLFKSLTDGGNPSETPLANLRTAKQVADLYLIRMGQLNWRRSLDMPNEPEWPGSAVVSGSEKVRTNLEETEVDR